MSTLYLTLIALLLALIVWNRIAQRRGPQVHAQFAMADGFRMNAKVRRGLLPYMLGKVFPTVFGMPLHLQGEFRDINGKVVRSFGKYNTVTAAGKAGVMDQILASPTLGKPTHMAIGTGTGGTTTLNAEIDRNALTSKTRSGAVVTFVADWAAGDGTSSGLTEAGLLTASSTGDLWLYSTFTAQPKNAGDSLTLTWTLTGS